MLTYLSRLSHWQRNHPCMPLHLNICHSLFCSFHGQEMSFGFRPAVSHLNPCKVLFVWFFEPRLLTETICITRHTVSSNAHISLFAPSTMARRRHWNAKNTFKITSELRPLAQSGCTGGKTLPGTFFYQTVCFKVTPAGSVFVLQWTVFLYERGTGQRNTRGPRAGSRQAAAFQDRQRESAI